MKKSRYYVYESPMTGYARKKYFSTIKEAKKFVRNRPNYPMVIHHIYKISEPDLWALERKYKIVKKVI